MPIRINHLDEFAKLDGLLHLALGVFDGVHIGHQTVIARAVEAAKREGGKSFVVTFYPHPIRIMAPGKAPSTLLATLDEKAAVVKALGVDGLMVVPFDMNFSQTKAEDFIELLTRAHVRTIAVGEDWRFGQARAGDVAMLREFAAKKSYHLEVVSPVMWDGERISSTRIRQAIRDGNFYAVKKMLGREYEIVATVREGRKLGRELGFPTANLRTGEQQLPSHGVWAVKANGIYQGVANLGTRPTVDGQECLLEVHLLDFAGNLYGKSLRIEFLKFLRKEKKFDSIESLKTQIFQDVSKSRQYFLGIDPES